MDFRFTLFNLCTLLVMSIAVVAAVWRFRGPVSTSLPFVWYAVMLGYALGFRYSLNVYALLAGLAIALAIRIRGWKQARWGEIPVYGYVVWRAVSLLAGW